MKRSFIITLLLAVAAVLPAQNLYQTVTLTPSAKACLLTCGPGNDFYTTWGHTALRICDSNAYALRTTVGDEGVKVDTMYGLDVVYNYGTFDFDTPHFYLKFAKGQLDYRLSRSGFNAFIFEYGMEGRYVTEQRLNLTLEELNRLFFLMEENYEPENRYYKYDFFKDNCATRVRDQINRCIDTTLSPRPFVEGLSDTNLTFRQLLDPKMDLRLEWWKLGIDLVLGSSCDRPVTNLDYDFCPFELANQTDTLTLLRQVMAPDSTLQCQAVPLAQPRTALLEETRELPPMSLYPTLVFWCLFLVVLALTVISWSRRSNGAKGWKLRGLDAPLFFVAGLVSLLIIFLWFFSDHYCTQANLNLIWATPLFFYFAFALRKSKRWVVILQMVALLVVLVGFWWLPQHFNAAVYPIVLILFVRLLDKLRI